MRFFYFTFILIFLFYGCTVKENKDLIKKEIEQQLFMGEDVDTIFLGAKFGMNKSTLWKKLNSTNKIHGFHQYEFEDEKYLKGLDWLVSDSFHNDSLLELSLVLHDFTAKHKNKNLLRVYNAIVNLYTEKYSEPNYQTKNKKYWFIKNLQILIEYEKNESIRISYQNSRVKERIDYQKYRFDSENTGSGYDLWYYNKFKNDTIDKKLKKPSKGALKLNE